MVFEIKIEGHPISVIYLSLSISLNWTIKVRENQVAKLAEDKVSFKFSKTIRQALFLSMVGLKWSRPRIMRGKSKQFHLTKLSTRSQGVYLF